MNDGDQTKEEFMDEWTAMRQRIHGSQFFGRRKDSPLTQARRRRILSPTAEFSDGASITFCVSMESPETYISYFLALTFFACSSSLLMSHPVAFASSL